MDANIPEFRSILVPLDDTERSRSALNYVRALAGRLGATVLLLSVVEPEALSSHHDGEPADADRARLTRIDEARADLEAIQRDLAEHGLEVGVQVVYGPAAESIVKVAEQERASVICMATHARGPLGRVLRGSVADEVMRHSDVPILLLRQAGQH